MFKVITYTEDATRSIYKIDGQKKTCSYAELLIYMAQSSGGNLALMNDAEKKPLIDHIAAEHRKSKPNEQQQEFSNIITTLEENLPLHQKCLNAEMVEGFKKFIAWTTDDKGVVIFLARTNSRGNTWKIVDNIINYITANQIDGVYLQEALSKEYFRTRLPGKNGPTMYQIIDETDGSWGEPINKARLYWAAWTKIKSNDHGLDENSVKDAITWMNNKETNLSPFTEVFTTGPTGWLYQLWLKSSRATIAMPDVMTNNPITPAFSYVDLSLAKEGRCDDFDGWLESLPDICRKPFCAVIYASLTDTIDRIPIVTWLHGEGNDGKSALMNSFAEMFGESLVGAVSASVATSEFGAEVLIGKRLIMLGDAQTGNILGTNLMHHLTGGDLYVINRKNEKHINYRFKSIVMIAANTAPNIDLYNRNEGRRIFYIPMHEPSEKTMAKYCVTDENGKIKRYATGMPVYNGYNLKAGLIKEMPAIMHKCKLAFEELTKGTYNTLILPDECFNLMLERCGSDEADVINSFCSQMIVRDVDAVTDSIDLNNAYLEFSHGIKARNDFAKYNFELGRLKRHIKVAYNLVSIRSRMVDDRKRVYKGIRLTTQTATQTGNTQLDSAIKTWSRPAQSPAIGSIL